MHTFFKITDIEIHMPCRSYPMGYKLGKNGVTKIWSSIHNEADILLYHVRVEVPTQPIREYTYHNCSVEIVTEQVTEEVEP